MRMGLSGFAIVGPEDGGGIPTNPIDEEDQTDEDYDDSARNVPLITPGNLRNSNFSSGRNVTLSTGKFEDKTIRAPTKPSIKFKNKTKNNVKDTQINTPVHAYISPKGDIVFIVKKKLSN